MASFTKHLGRQCFAKSYSGSNLGFIFRSSTSAIHNSLPARRNPFIYSASFYAQKHVTVINANTRTDFLTFTLNRPFCGKSPSENEQIAHKQEEKPSVIQRFKNAYKEYGKTLIVVHVVTSVFWYGGFYVLARSGVDLLPLLVKIGASESIQSKYLAAGDFLVAYILYELTKPIRYFATLFGTRQTVVLLRKKGYIPPLKPEDKLRNLAKEGREELKESYNVRKAKLKLTYVGKRTEYSSRWQTMKNRVKRRQPTFKSGVSRRNNGTNGSNS